MPWSVPLSYFGAKIQSMSDVAVYGDNCIIYCIGCQAHYALQYEVSYAHTHTRVSAYIVHRFWWWYPYNTKISLDDQINANLNWCFAIWMKSFFSYFRPKNSRANHAQPKPWDSFSHDASNVPGKFQIFIVVQNLYCRYCVCGAL